MRLNNIPHVTPLGYKRKDKKIVIDYSTKDVVVRIFELYSFYGIIVLLMNIEK